MSAARASEESCPNLFHDLLHADGNFGIGLRLEGDECSASFGVELDVENWADV